MASDDGDPIVTGESHEVIPDVEFIGLLSRDQDFDVNYGLVRPDEAVIVRAYSDDSDDMMLMELRPRFVVMFDPSLEFLRRMEVFDRLLAPHIPPKTSIGLSKFESWAAAADVLPDVRGVQ